MASLLFAQRRRRNRAPLALRNFESATAEVIANAQPRIPRLTLYVLGAMIAAVIYLICVVQLDRIVVATGHLVPIGGTFVVQPLDKGIVREMRVRAGDIVRKGQVLATLDPTFTAADLRHLEDEAASLSAREQRIEAQEAGSPFTPAEDGKYGVLELQIYRQEQQAFQSEIDELDASISKDQSEIAGAEREIAADRQRLSKATEIEKMRQQLEKDGYGSRLALMTAAQDRLQITGLLATDETKLEATRHDLAELEAKRRAYVQNWHAKHLEDLVETKNKLDTARQELAKARRMQSLADLEAPEDAVVVEVNRHASPGAVVTQAEPVFTLVPVGAPLEAEADVEAKDIGFIHVGDPVKLKFSAYHFLEHGTGDGVVKTISQDSFNEDREHREKPTFFRSRIAITAVRLHDVPSNFRLIPGMTLDADIVVGRRTVAWYLIGGVMRSGAEAMREP